VIPPCNPPRPPNQPYSITLNHSPPPPQDFDWAALSARQLEPPRRPKESDFSKRKAELEAARTAPAVPSPAELAECDRVFADF
jgi:hypothetical protein